MADTRWHYADDIQELTEEFHDRHARVHPNLNSARQAVDSLVTKIRDHLKFSECQMKVSYSVNHIEKNEGRLE